MGEEKKDNFSKRCYFGCERCITCIYFKVKKTSYSLSSYCAKGQGGKKSLKDNLKELFNVGEKKG